MNNKTSKEKLINTICVDNEYLDKMLELVERNKYLPVDKKSAKGRQIHHILPRLYFRKNKLEVDNSDSNLISLSLGEHFLIHYYLWRCAKDEYKGKCACAVHFMIASHKKDIFHGFTKDESAAIIFANALDETYGDYVEEMAKLHRGKPKSEKVKQLLSERMMGNKINVGRPCSEETRQKIREKAVLRPGRKKTEEEKAKISQSMKKLQFTEEHKKHLSEALKGRKCPWAAKPRSEETKRKISEAKRKSSNPIITQ